MAEQSADRVRDSNDAVLPQAGDDHMIYVSSPLRTPPDTFRNELQEKTYEALTALGIPFERVDTDEVITMEDCARINEVLNMKMVKTLFLCSRKKTEYYLLIMDGEKPFRSKDFSSALGVSRLSFAPAEQMETMLGTKIGAATVFSVLLESARDVRVVFDRDVTAEEWYGCSDGTTVGYLKIRTADILQKLLPYAKRSFTEVRL